MAAGAGTGQAGMTMASDEARALAATLRDLDGIVRILTCGSVDDGKSTLIGRLLWEASDLPEDTRQGLIRQAGPDGIPDVSLLLDGLVAEREQGITIDIAWRYFDAGRRRFVVIDSPGHEQYTRNMASGASHADIAIMLVDARHGVKRQTRRHAAILDLVGVKRVVVAVNKMDLIDWSQSRFEEIAADFATITERFAFEEAVALPVSAKLGDNVAGRSAHTPWYAGETLLEIIDRAPSRIIESGSAFRFPVQTVLRGGTDFRGLAGTVASGVVRVGDPVFDGLSRRQANVRRIATMDGDLEQASAGQAVVVQLDTDLDVARGAVLSSPDAVPVVARAIEARLVWLADSPLDASHGLLLRTATDLVPLSSIAIRARLDLETLQETAVSSCSTNDIVIADLSLAQAVAVDRFADNREMGAFVLVDALTGATLAGGVIVTAAARSASEGNDAFVLTNEMLARGVCAGLASSDPEFRRRAQEVAIILRAAGVTVARDKGPGES
ncbi:MAG: GTP-binding protein [Hyphomicrobiaceae bacterium]